MYKEKKPQIGDLVRIIQSETVQRVHNPDRVDTIGIVVGHFGIRSEVEWNDGTYSEPMRTALEVL